MPSPGYDGHPVGTTISQILDLEKQPAFADPAVSSNEQFAYSRDKVFAMAHAVDALLRSTPPELTSLPALSQMQAHLQNCLNELNAFVGNKNPGHINNESPIQKRKRPIFGGVSRLVSLQGALPLRLLPFTNFGINHSPQRMLGQL